MPTSRKTSSYVVAVLCLVVFSACEFSYSVNSSGGGSDYFEEPLSSSVEKYAPALELSNQFLNGIKRERVDEIYGTLSEDLKNVVSIDDAHSTLGHINDLGGKIVEFLPGQWAFRSGEEDGVDVIYSGKIVKHEKREYVYVFEFIEDGSYDRINGFRMLPRQPNESVIDGMKRVIASGS